MPPVALPAKAGTPCGIAARCQTDTRAGETRSLADRNSPAGCRRSHRHGCGSRIWPARFRRSTAKAGHVRLCSHKSQSMKPESFLPAARDKLLFTPGPLTTSLSVKQAMLHDAGSWHFEFNAVVKSIRDNLLKLAGVSQQAGYEAIPLQGSGTFGVEAGFATCVPPT